MAQKSSRWFAGMDTARQREIARKGGKAAHARGTAHRFTREEARRAALKGKQSLEGTPCPNCQGDRLRFVSVSDYRVVVGGRPVTVPAAGINQCPACGFEVVTEVEARRWIDLAGDPGAVVRGSGVERKGLP